MSLEEIDLDIDIEDRLSCLTADLVEFESNSLFLQRLFSIDAGKWVEVGPLCSDLRQVEVQLRELREVLEGELRVTWLEYPDAANGAGYCLILFFVEALHWNNLALYNKQLFMRKTVDRASKVA